MVPPLAHSDNDFGRRIADARESEGRTQAELADAIGLDRTAVAKIEAGTRKVSAIELVAIAASLNRPIDWFVFESPHSVVSRRRDPAVGGYSRALDRVLESVARDVDFLIRRELLTTTPRPAPQAVPQTYEDAENLAARARTEAGLDEGPVLDIQAACERLGLLGFSLALGFDAGDAAYVEVAQLGVAVINGSTDARRRRFSLAHELGHHLVGDAYEPTPTLGSHGDNESLLSAFAAYFLMPRSAVLTTWHELNGQSSRMTAIAVAGRFKVSWTAACNQLRNLNLIDSSERERLVNTEITKGELLEVGERWVDELEPPSVPSGYARAVLGAYRSKRLTPARTVELLQGAVGEEELPAIQVDELSLNLLRGDFEAPE
jgi:Zn-dependent peptidase ImmA (M78 family)/transcriptional regulator with XRE-family HTH domain